MIPEAYYYVYLTKKLLFSNDLEKDIKDLKEIILDTLFLECLQDVLVTAQEYDVLPKKCYINIDKILKFVQENAVLNEKNKDLFLELYNGCIEEFNKVKNNNSYEIYNSELLKRLDDVEKYSNTKSFGWNLKDLEESIRFDSALIGLLILDDKEYKEKVQYFVLNDKTIYSIKSLLLDAPDLFKNKKVKFRINEILDYNINLYLNIHKYGNKINEQYIINNELEDNDYYDKIEKLNEESLKLKNRFSNLKNQRFNGVGLNYINNFVFNVLYESILFLDPDKFEQTKEIITNDYLNLGYLYNVIDNNSVVYSSLEIKKRVIDIMSLFKEKHRLKGKDLEVYNSYLAKLNQIKIDTVEYFSSQMAIKLPLNQLIVDTLIAKITNSYNYSFCRTISSSIAADYVVVNTLISSNEDYDKFKQLIFNSDYYLHSIRRIMIECPVLLNDQLAKNRLIDILNTGIQMYKDKELENKNFYKANKKLLKKIKSI